MFESAHCLQVQPSAPFPLLPFMVLSFTSSYPKLQYSKLAIVASVRDLICCGSVIFKLVTCGIYEVQSIFSKVTGEKNF